MRGAYVGFKKEITRVSQISCGRFGTDQWSKRTFDKGYLPNWTTELFIISERIPGRYPYVIKKQIQKM